jgi:hypothetical protein
MYDLEIHPMQSDNYYKLMLTTPVAIGSGSEDYNVLRNKPRINGVELIGNKTLEAIGIPDLSNVPMEALSNEELDSIVNS